MSMHTLNGLGWQWLENGVILCVQLDGKKLHVFVPLNRVWHEFHTELAKVGCPLPASVGEPITVSGLFGSIAHAAKSVAHAVTSNAVTRAAGKVAATAANYAAHAANTIPVVGPVAASVTRLMTAPLNVAEALAKGGRIDRVAMNSLAQQIKDVRTVAPYAQTVLSVVPGVGTGLSAAIGAGLALANGQNITDAVLAGVRGALPGGALAQAAFDVAHGVMAGQPITAIAVNALPGLSAQQKDALMHGVALAKDLAAGKNVSQAVVDAATSSLPPDVRKAVQIGAALAHAKNLQGAVGALSAASTLQSDFAKGLQAAAQIKSLPPHLSPPKALIDAVRVGLAAKQKTQQIVQQAQAGHPVAKKLVTAMQFHQSTPAATKVGQRLIRGRYHTAPITESHPAVGALWPAIASRVVTLRAAHRPSQIESPVASIFQAHAFAHHARNQRSFMAPRLFG